MSPPRPHSDENPSTNSPLSVYTAWRREEDHPVEVCPPESGNDRDACLLPNPAIVESGYFLPTAVLVSPLGLADIPRRKKPRLLRPRPSSGWGQIVYPHVQCMNNSPGTDSTRRSAPPSPCAHSFLFHLSFLRVGQEQEKLQGLTTIRLIKATRFSG